MARILALLTVLSSAVAWNSLCFTVQVVHHAANSDQNSDKLIVKDDVAYIGGTNYFLAMHLNASDIENVKRIDYPATEETRKLCKQFSPDSHCENTVRILEFTSHGSLLVCGTNAKQSKCHHYNPQNSTFEEVDLDARLWMPESPTAKSVSLLSNSGEFYVSSVPSPAMGGILYRKLGKNLRSEKDWFDEPEFIGMHDVPEKNYTYIFFNEKSKYFVRNKFVADNDNIDYYSTVARVCKNDRGGSIKKTTWMTFSKVRLICPWPEISNDNKASLYYDELISTYRSGKSVFGLFQTNRNWNLPMYALAEFDTNGIDDVVDGKLFVDNQTRYFHPTKPNAEVSFRPSDGNAPPFAPGQCPKSLSYELKSEFERFVLKNTLIKMNVLPKRKRPFYVGQSETKFRFIFTEKYSWCETIFLLSADGYIKKIILMPDGSVTELYEEQALVGTGVIIAADLVEDKGFILATTSSEVISIPLSNCSVYTDCKSCYTDPHCHWNADLENLKFSCLPAATTVQESYRKCPDPPKSPSNLSTKLTKGQLEISWIGPELSTIITLKVQKTREVIHRVKTADQKLIIKRSTLQEGCIYEVDAAVLNETILSDEVATTFHTSLDQPQLTLSQEEDLILIKWKKVPGASLYVCEIADTTGEIVQEVSFRPILKEFVLNFQKTDTGKRYTVKVRAMSDDNVEAIASEEAGPVPTRIAAVTVLDVPSECTGISIALAVFAGLFVVCLIINLYNVWIIKPRVNELRSDSDGCSYKRQYLLIWNKKHETDHLKCDDVAVSTTTA